MPLFFSDEIGVEFIPFGLLHLLLFAIVIIGSSFIIIYRRKIREYKFERRIAKSIAVFAFSWEIALYVWYLINGIWEWEHSLPISLCAFTLFIGIFSLIFKKFSLFEIGYFWTWGAIASVLFPDIPYSFDRFRFYQFMFGHMLFFFMYVYMISVYKWYPNWKSWKKSCITLTTIVIILIITSNVTGKNLMFMLNGAGSPFEMFEGGSYFMYLFGVITMSFSIIFIWFIPWIFYHRVKNRKTKIEE